MRIKITLGILMVGLLLAVPAYCQNYIFVGSSSAGAVGQSVKFNCDIVDPFGIPNFGVFVSYKGESDADYSRHEMTPMDEPPFYVTTSEYDQSFNSNPGLLNYYFSAGTDTFMATQSPKNVNDDFPPPAYLYAPFGADAQGDAVSPDGAWLDLTGSGMCYSDTRIYGYLENASQTWPSNQGLNYYIYALGFASLNIQDTVIYAMTNANIPFVISPGLYKFSLVDTSFERLGDADYQIADGRLHMACDIATFDNDPDWPGWPPPSGFLVSMGITITAGFFDQAINDYTYPTIYEPRTQYEDFNNNNAPVVLNTSMDVVPGVTVTAYANYFDADNNLPLTRLLYFDWGFYGMASYDHIYSDTSQFLKVLTWPGDGWHYFNYEFSDGVDSYETQPDSIYLTTVGIDDQSAVPFNTSLNQNYPNPFNSSTVISYEIEEAQPVNITIYDITGRKVAEIVNGEASVGTHTIVWTGVNEAGKSVPSGVYFYKLSTPDGSIVRKMNYVK